MKRVFEISFLSILFILFGQIKSASAQQEGQLSQYIFNSLAFNPAYAGSNEVFNVSALYRAQWVNFDGAPTTQTITGNAPLRDKKYAVGGTIYNDALGYTNKFGVFGDFSYGILFEESQISFGVKAGFDVFQANYTKYSPIDPDPNFDQNITKFLPNVGFGVYYFSDYYYVGFSAPKLLTNSYTKDENNNGTDNKQVVTYYFNGGYVFKLTSFLDFKPSFLFKFAINAPSQIDLNANFLFIKRFWVGVMYRPGAAWGGMMQYQISQKFRFGYSVDFATTSLRMYNSGTHEFMLSYDFSNYKKRITSPRYF